MLQLNPDSAAGTVVKDGLEIPVLRIGEKYYFEFSDSLVDLQAGRAVTFAGAPG
ncbi:hypothetical protein ACFVYA_49170 [Amycolatopsis sp. NPDC058278]|uniref:hypothetical protein n=1 Tax=Amycolatopsis sp. NPDC058278 TaxID=3346417 RepID=UPI0036DD8E38